MLVPGLHEPDIFCPKNSDNPSSSRQIMSTYQRVKRWFPQLMKAGDVLFFNGSTIHSSYPNLSQDLFRCAFICDYVPFASQDMSGEYCPLYNF